MMESTPFNFRRVIIWIGRIVLAAIFIYAGYAKLFRPGRESAASRSHRDFSVCVAD